MFLWWIIAVTLWVVFLYLTATIAASKGHNGFLWAILAVFLPIIAFVIVMFLPNRYAHR